MTSGGHSAAVSVVVIADGASVATALAALSAQTFHDFEVILLHRTPLSAVEMAPLPSGSAVRLVHVPPVNSAQLKNRGLGEARGDFVCLAHGPFAMAPTFLERAVGAMTRDSSVDWVSARCVASGEQTCPWTPSTLVDALARCPLPVPTLVRKSAVVASGGFDERAAANEEDEWDFRIRLLARNRGVVLAEPLLHASFSLRELTGAAHACEETAFGQQVDRHLSLYSQNLIDVLLAIHTEMAAIQTEKARLQHRIHAFLNPSIESLTHEAARLNVRRPVPLASSAQAPTRDAVAELQCALEGAHLEIEALRRSLSWRITLPLRWAGYIVMRWRRRDR